MIYFVGTVGFIGGFILGQMILAFLQRGKTREQLLSDKSLRWKYGLLNWLVALLTAASSVYLLLVAQAH